MFRISKLADYGTMVMALLAKSSEQWHNARAIADKTHISQPMISKILKLLAKHGLLVSTRGVQGGYALSRTPAKIQLLDILHAMGMEVAMTDCCRISGHCDVLAYCGVRGHWHKINQVVLNAINAITLDDMIKPHSNLVLTPLVQTITQEQIDER